MPPDDVGAASTASHGGSDRVYLYEKPDHFPLGHLVELWKDETLCDLRLSAAGCDPPTEPCSPGGKRARVEPTEIPCHRIVLAAMSECFRKMFTTGLKETGAQRVTIQDISHEVLLALVQFMYTGKISIDCSNVLSLLHHATYFLLEDVRRECVRFLSSTLSVSNCFERVAVASRYSCSDLAAAARAYATRNFRVFAASETLKTLRVDALLEILTSDMVCSDGEESIYTAAIEWVRAEPQQRADHLPRLLSEVRLLQLDKRFLLDTVGEEPLIQDSPQCMRIYCNAVKHVVASTFVDRTAAARFECESWSRERAHSVLPFLISKHEWNNDAIKMPYKSKWPSACVLGGMLFVAGGSDTTVGACSQAWCYDPCTGAWRSVADICAPVYQFGLCASHSRSLLYAVGGQNRNVMVYDPLRNEWTFGPSTSEERAESAVMHEEVIYVAGAKSRVDGVKSYSSSVECWDTRTPDWRSLSDMTTPRWRPQLAACGGRIYAIGGNEGAGVTVESLDLRARAWRGEPTVAAESRQSYYSTVVADRIAVALTGPTWDKRTQIMYMWSDRDSWQNVNELPPCDAFAFTHFEQALFVLGGSTKSSGAVETTDVVHCLAI